MEKNKKMLDFKNQKKEWYHNNKEFLRLWEISKEYKNFRSFRDKLLKLKRCLSILNEIWDNSIKKPKNSPHFRFYRVHIRKLKQKIKNMEKNYEKSFNLMKNAKIKAENLFLKQKLIEFQTSGGYNLK